MVIRTDDGKSRVIVEGSHSMYHVSEILKEVRGHRDKKIRFYELSVENQPRRRAPPADGADTGRPK